MTGVQRTDDVRAMFRSHDHNVAQRFRWRMRDGEMIQPSEMRTTHLFYTLRMIWNNSVPEHARVGRVKMYHFGPTYTTDYMREAVKSMGKELAERTDLPGSMRMELETMAGFLRRAPKLVRGYV